MSEEAAAPAKAAPRFAHIASRVFEVPLLIEHSKLVAILNVLGPRLGFDAPAVDVDAALAGDAQRHGMLLEGARIERREAGYYVADGVAILPVIGTLVQRSSWITDASGMVSYSSIERMFHGAMQDTDVREVVLEIDSAGGEVAGAFDLADRMYEARGKKPITAVATELAASAAYLIASAADEIVVPRTGSVGSIGVVAAHYDYSKALEKGGVAVTLIHAGARKVDGNPYQPLPEAVKAEWQAEIDEVYSIFVKTVARNRGMSEERVRETEAGMFMGAAAVDVGLATRVSSFASEMSLVRQRNSTTRSPTMSADVEAEKRAQRDRIKAILGCDESKGREQMARHLALETDLTVDAAKALLVKTPLERKNRLDALMEQFGTPGVRSEEVTGAEAPTLSADEIFARRAEAVKKSRN